MKKKSTALLLALMMMLSAVSAFAQPAESTAAQADDPVLASVNGKAITKSQVEAQIPNFLNNQFITEASDYRSVLDVIIRREIIMKKIGDMGFDQFTPDERIPSGAKRKNNGMRQLPIMQTIIKAQIQPRHGTRL